MNQDARDIVVLSAIQAVRARPAMYLGDLDDPDLPNFLIRELVCCARDEAKSGLCTQLDIRILPGGRAVVRDDGPSLPITQHASGRPLAEVYLSDLRACHRAKPHQFADSLCRVSIAVVNAVCRDLTVRICVDGNEWRQTYAFGEPLSAFARVGPSDERTAELAITLDTTLLPHVEPSFDALQDWILREVTDLRVRLTDERDGRAREFPPRHAPAAR